MFLWMPKGDDALARSMAFESEMHLLAYAEIHADRGFYRDTPVYTWSRYGDGRSMVTVRCARVLSGRGYQIPVWREGWSPVERAKAEEFGKGAVG